MRRVPRRSSMSPTRTENQCVCWIVWTVTSKETCPEPGRGLGRRLGMTEPSSFRHFKTSPKIIRLVVMMCIGFPLSLRNVEDLQPKRSIEVSHNTVRYWRTWFGPMPARISDSSAVRHDDRVPHKQRLIHQSELCRSVELVHKGMPNGSVAITPRRKHLRPLALDH